MRTANRQPWAANMYLRMWAAQVVLGMWVAKLHPAVWVPNLRPRRLRRSYRRFKQKKQYDSPLLIFFFDTLFGLTPVVIVSVGFIFAYRYFFSN